MADWEWQSDLVHSEQLGCDADLQLLAEHCGNMLEERGAVIEEPNVCFTSYR